MLEKSLKIDPASIAIATNTLYPSWYEGSLKRIEDTDKVRGDLALRFFKTSCDLGYKTVVVDGNSSSAFLFALSSIKDLKIISRGKIKRSPARREAIEICSRLSGVRAIVLTEPEKTSFLTDCLSAAVKPVLERETDIVLPKRDSGLFVASYPNFQYESELEANILFEELLRSHGLFPSGEKDLDMIFGPRVFRNDQKIVDCFMQKFSFKNTYLAVVDEYFDPEQIPATLFFPIVFAQKKNLRIKTVTVPFRYPVLQKKNEEAMKIALFLKKRRDQYIGTTVSLMHLIGFLEGYSGSRIKINKLYA